MTVYVDDILITGSSKDLIQFVKAELHGEFTIKDLGEANFFLGMEVKHFMDGISLCQTQYIIDILEDMKMMDCKCTSTPLPAGLKLAATGTSEQVDHQLYRRVVGRLIYLNLSRPDIAFATQQLSQFLSHPTSSHWKAVQHLLRYLKGTMNFGLHFSPAEWIL